MRVFISADIEGVTGLTTWDQCGGPAGSRYDFDFARKMMVHDVNAAIRGAKEAGADLVVVKDSHGNSRNLTVDLLEPGTHLVSGIGCGATDGMMQGIDATFDACVLIGYHAKAGTPNGVMEHTISGQVHRLWLNDVETGEMGLSAGVAGRYGVPWVAASSDDAGCAEALAMVPGISVASVKTGLGRYMAVCKTPDVTGPIIQNAVRDGVRNARDIEPVRFEGPVRLKLEFNRAESADKAERYPGVSRGDGYTVLFDAIDFEEAHTAFRTLVVLGSVGIESIH